MKIAIYQIDSDRDLNGVEFMALDRLERLQGDSEVDSSIYEKVYCGDVECKDLEDVYEMFNLRKPEKYQRRSLSVGDVVEVLDSAGCPDLVGRIRFYNSATAFEEMFFTNEDYFRAEIREARDVGRCIEVDDLRGIHVPCVDVGFHFCDDFGFKKVSFEPDKTVDLWGPRQDKVHENGQNRLDDLIKACKAVNPPVGRSDKAMGQDMDL